MPKVSTQLVCQDRRRTQVVCVPCHAAPFWPSRPQDAFTRGTRISGPLPQRTARHHEERGGPLERGQQTSPSSPPVGASHTPPVHNIPASGSVTSQTASPPLCQLQETALPRELASNSRSTDPTRHPAGKAGRVDASTHFHGSPPKPGLKDLLSVLQTL